MKLTSLIIAPKKSWDVIGKTNPLRAVVKLSSEQSTIECVLSEESTRKMIDLCAQEIADQASARVGEFVSAVTAIDTNKSTALLEGN